MQCPSSFEISKLSLFAAITQPWVSSLRNTSSVSGLLCSAFTVRSWSFDSRAGKLDIPCLTSTNHGTEKLQIGLIALSPTLFVGGLLIVAGDNSLLFKMC
jgi:hypothetical protein